MEIVWNLGVGAIGAVGYMFLVKRVVVAYRGGVRRQKVHPDMYRAIVLGILASFAVYASWGCEVVTPIRQLLLSLLAGFSFETVWHQFYSKRQRNDFSLYATPLTKYDDPLL